MLTDNQIKTLKFLADIFQKENIEFQITGGLAAIIHGAQRPLYDIDIDIYKTDVEKVRVLLGEYIIEDWTSGPEDEDDLFDLSMMTLVINDVPVDISQIEDAHIRSSEGQWVYLPENMECQTLEFENLILPVQTKESLISYKKVLRRDTDLEDIKMLS
jgi:hypothetical protein